MYVEIPILNPVKKHIHSCKVECGRILLLAEYLVGIAFAGGTKEQRTGTASRVIDGLQPVLSGDDDFRQNLADLLRSIELTGFLACSGGELPDHIFIRIAQYVNILRILKTEINAVERDKDITDEPVLVFSRLSKLRRSQVNVGEQATKVILTFLSDGAVFNLLQRALKSRKDILFSLNHRYDGGEQVFRLNEISQVLDALRFQFLLQFFITAFPGGLEVYVVVL